MTMPSGALPDAILAQLAERVLAGSALEATAQQLAADSRAAGDADRLARKGGVAELLTGLPSPLVAITRTLAGVPVVVGYAAELNPAEVASELERGRGVGELALRHGLAKVGAEAGGVPPDPGGLVAPAAKVIRAELALPAAVSHGVAARFVGAYLLLHFVTNAVASFGTEAIGDACAALAADAGPVARFVRTFWDRA
jgi:hypothetical protein